MTKKAISRKRDETFNTEKMMRYDDFTDEDVGNIVMDAEPLPEGCRIFQTYITPHLGLIYHAWIIGALNGQYK